MLKIVSPAPTNSEIGIPLEKKESTIRAKMKKMSEDEIEKMTLFYKRDTYPFIKIEEYFKILEMEFEKKEFEEIKNNTLTSIEKKEIVGTYYTDGNNTKNLFITPVNNKLKEIKELYEENNIKMPITISIGNHKGGANKSTTVVNLASSLAYFGYKVLIADVDTQGNASASFGIFEGDYNYTIVDLITMSTDIDIKEKVKNSIINIDLSNKFENGVLGKIDLIPNNASMSEKFEDLPTMSRNLGTIENTLDRILSLVKDEYDFVLIDLPPRTDVILRTAMIASDYFIISLNPQPFAKMGMPNILNPIRKYEPIYKQEKGKDFKILGGVVGFYEKGVTVQDVIYNQMKKDIIECTKDTSSLFDTIIPKSTQIQEAQQGSGAILFYQPSHKATRCFFDLTIEILERILVDKMSEVN